MKFCKDCKFYREDEHGYRVCGHSAAYMPLLDLVTGDDKGTSLGCAFMRIEVSGRCGPEAHYFELAPPKPPTFWQRVRRALAG